MFTDWKLQFCFIFKSMMFKLLFSQCELKMLDLKIRDLYCKLHNQRGKLGLYKYD